MPCRAHHPDADDLATLPDRLRCRLTSVANDGPAVTRAAGPIGQPFYLAGRRKPTTPHNLQDTRPSFVANDPAARAEARQLRHRVANLRFAADTVACPYCFHDARLVTRADVLPRPGPNATAHVWWCAPCDAWVNCHENTHRPMGSLANRDLRRLRHEAHRAFDPVWQSGRLDRRAAYALLASAMELPVDDCHFALFGPVECQRAIELCHTHARLSALAAS